MTRRRTLYIPPPPRRSIVKIGLGLILGAITLILISAASMVLLAVMAASMGVLP